MTTTDNQLAIITSGAADWDADIDANFRILERGYHVTQRAGTVVNTGMVLWCDSSGFFKPFDPNSVSILPMAMAYTAAASGDSMQALAWGIVRSLAINSAIIPGKAAWVSAATPGLLVSSSAIQNFPAGIGLPGGSILFNPAKAAASGGASALAALSDVNTTGVSNGKVLAWSDASSKWAPASPGGGGALAGLSDVNTTGLADGKVLTWVDAASKWEPAAAGGSGLPPTYWDILDCGQCGYSLSAGYLTACGNGTNTGFSMMRATPSVTAGSQKLYVEFYCGTTGNYSAVGLVTPTAFIDDYAGDTSGWGIDSSGSVHTSGGGSVTGSTSAWGGTLNVTIALAIDFGAGTIQIYKDNVAGALISGITFSGAYKLSVAGNGTINRYTLRTQSSNQKYSPPAGFSAWN